MLGRISLKCAGHMPYAKALKWQELTEFKSAVKRELHDVQEAIVTVTGFLCQLDTNAYSSYPAFATPHLSFFAFLSTFCRSI